MQDVTTNTGAEHAPAPVSFPAKTVPVIVRHSTLRAALTGSQDDSLDQRRNLAQILDEPPHLFVTGFVVRRSQNGGWMYCRHYPWCDRRLDELASMLRHAKIAPQERRCCRRSKAHKDLGTNGRDFRIKPGPASGNFGGVGLFMDSPFSARLPFEMLYNIRKVDLPTFHYAH